MLTEEGYEYGVTTGRRRRCGWFDGPIANYASRVNGLTDIALTKLDVLSAFDTIKVCVAYDVDGERYTSVPEHQVRFEHAEPIYERSSPAGSAISPAAAALRSCRKRLRTTWRLSRIGTHPRDVHWRWRWSRADHQPILEVIGLYGYCDIPLCSPDGRPRGIFVCKGLARSGPFIHRGGTLKADTKPSTSCCWAAAAA